MGRKKIDTKDKKTTVSITISEDNFKKLEEVKTNKSKLINWLLREHFNLMED